MMDVVAKSNGAAIGCGESLNKHYSLCRERCELRLPWKRRAGVQHGETEQRRQRCNSLSLRLLPFYSQFLHHLPDLKSLTAAPPWQHPGECVKVKARSPPSHHPRGSLSHGAR
ncbi:hypothetical protein JOB18_040210 [Solea senegalensis]|uniref:Uncharacterized protein n=1 Tax=Solea senegalensis TaxID=28829 RepID=A0AAV6PTZ2_SOLSE|nr:hypothetical protein JOB18_040210 [Solea senegalensis]KAG7475902.1 hypothetical protein JOB18_040210 [Solea senegalensis]KAG7475903.1 hypothetical protein JOB18_040210 [Solea senegalensis]KAG7475904.1 hypothetical protein JOB18_040210 [Solea senegalensis]